MLNLHRICSRRLRCPARILVVDSVARTCLRGAMSGTGLRRAGTGKCYLPGRASWWGTGLPLSTRSFFGGVRVGHFRCGSSRPRRRWYVALSGRRTSTSVATWMRCMSGSPIPGRFFRDLTRAMILWWFLLFGYPPLAPQEPRVN